MTIGVRPPGIIKPNNAPVAARGLITTTAGPDQCHILPVNRTAMIRKITWYNPNAVQALVIFGTVTNAVAPAWVPLTSTIVALPLLDGILEEEECPDIEWYSDTTALAGGVSGDIWVLSTQLNVLIRLTVEEFGV